MRKVATTLRDQLASLIGGLGYEFVGSELHGESGNTTLRIYIDSDHGITLDDCSRVSYQVSAMLDVEDPIQGHYSLEISSPGLNRPLFELAHYQKQVGHRVKVRVTIPIHNQRKFVGTLVRVEGESIHLLMENEEIILPISQIEKANVIADIR